MIINDIIYTCGDKAVINLIIEQAKAGVFNIGYFVYKTNPPKFQMQISNYNMLLKENNTPVILGVATTMDEARQVALYIIKVFWRKAN